MPETLSPDTYEIPGRHRRPVEDESFVPTPVERATQDAEQTPPLDENAIRAEIANILGKETQDASLMNTETRLPQPEGPVEDVHKAWLMAHAEDEHQTNAAAHHREFKRLVGLVEDPNVEHNDSKLGVLWKTARHPRTSWRATREAFRDNMDLQRAQNASELAASKYDKLLAARGVFDKKLETTLPSETDNSREAIQGHFSKEAQQTVEQLRLDQQLEEQLEILHRADVLEPLTTGEYGIKNPEGQEFTAPKLEDVYRLVEKNRELINYKSGQGFSRLLLVPDAAPVEKMAEGLQHQVEARSESGELFDTEQGTVTVAPGREKYEPISVKPDVKSVEAITGIEKEKAVAGWKIVLVKDMPNTPTSDKDPTVTMGGRKEFVADPVRIKLKSPQEYLNILKNDPAYRGESGFTQEMWFSYALTEIQRSGVLVDSTGSALLLGSSMPGEAFKSRQNVPWMGWDLLYSKAHGEHKAWVNKLVTGSLPRRMAFNSAGVRTAVELT